MSDRSSDRDVILLTGATGFIGHSLLAELIRRGRRCAVLLRPPLNESLDRLAALLWELGIDANAGIAEERLHPIEADLRDGIRLPNDVAIRTVIHAAAATQFQRDAHGEPERTNVHGTGRLLQAMIASRIARLHLVSSAYVCGRVDRPVPEGFHVERPDFHNAYEASKWQAERIATQWAEDHAGCLTIHRPSIVVGDASTGRATRFTGFYISARATEFLARMFSEADSAGRHAIPLRIRGRAHERQNLVPVDWVARMMAEIVCRPERHGRVYHLVNPDPPSNATIKRALEMHFDIAGGRFVEPERFPDANLNEHERLFSDISKPIEHYFLDAPCFVRENTASIERETFQPCPTVDIPFIQRLVGYAQRVGWGRPLKSRRGHVPGCTPYFEEFLPAHVGRSRVARMAGLSATIRFVIEDEADGEWVCRFERGRLTDVHRGVNGIREDFGYRATRDVFWDSISGTVHPQELFLTGRAEIFGDTEKALKMAMILHEFTREFPCFPESTRAKEERP